MAKIFQLSAFSDEDREAITACVRAGLTYFLLDELDIEGVALHAAKIDREDMTHYAHYMNSNVFAIVPIEYK